MISYLFYCFFDEYCVQLLYIQFFFNFNRINWTDFHICVQWRNVIETKRKKSTAAGIDKQMDSPWLQIRLIFLSLSNAIFCFVFFAFKINSCSFFLRFCWLVSSGFLPLQTSFFLFWKRKKAIVYCCRHYTNTNEKKKEERRNTCTLYIFLSIFTQFNLFF